MTTKNKAAQALRSIPSAIRSEASRTNGAKGGRPGYQLHKGILVMPVRMFGGKRGWVVKGLNDIYGSRDAAVLDAKYPSGSKVRHTINPDGSVTEVVG